MTLTFLHPEGLWLLLGIPLLIVIYLIRTQHEDRPVSSTYIWKLSEKFLKKRLPFQRFRRILLLLLQLLTVLIAAMLVARPAIVNGKITDYILIIDSSGSMATENTNGISRFDRAIEQMDRMTGELDYGHRISIIEAAEKPSLLLEGSDSISEVKLTLQNLRCRNGDSDLAAAMNLAERTAFKTANPKVLLYTDRSYAKEAGELPERLELINVCDPKHEWDVAVELQEAVSSEKEKETVFNGVLQITGKSKTVSVGLRINGKAVDAKQYACADGSEVPVSFTQSISSFDSAELFVLEEDGLQGNNSSAICRQAQRDCSILLISPSPLYLQSALEALRNFDLTVAHSVDELPITGYDLYIFDRICPAVLPSDGSLLLIAPESLPAGLAYGKHYDREARLKLYQTAPSPLTEGLKLQDTVVQQYTALVGNATWESRLTCNYSTVLSTKRYPTGLTCAVLSFDLHDSNLPLQADYLLLMRNLVRFCAPSLLPKTDYAVDETVTVSVLPGCTDLYLKEPSGAVQALSTASGQAFRIPTEPGLYTVVEKTGEGGIFADFFVHLPESELHPTEIGQLSGVTPGATGTEAESSLREIALWIAIALLVILITEWGIYYYDQY